MILRILVASCVFAGACSLNMLLPTEFKQRFEDKCFQNEETDPFKINGQDYPLSNTIENFISLAEKFEIANPSLTLREELFYFIKNYMYEDILLSTVGVSDWAPRDTDFSDVKNMWEPEDGYRNRNPTYNEPFTDDETCSLYFMISHSIVDEPGDLYRSAPNNFSLDSRTQQRNDINPKVFYPQEIGVVAIQGTTQAVSLSRVLVGLYTGMNKDRKKELTDFPRIRDSFRIIEDKLAELKDKTVDPLYTLTLAEVLMLSAWTMSDRRNLTEDGMWISYPSDINDFCPMVYKLKSAKQAYSYSSVRGAIDGLILGSVVRAIVDKKETSRLSQILRMYYSREGITLEQGVSDIQLTSPAVKISFCNRQEISEPLKRNLETQMELYGFLVSGKFEVVKNLNAAKDLFARHENYLNENQDIKEYCRIPLALETPDSLPRETFLDIIVMMDTKSMEANFKTQQQIVGNLAKHMDLRHGGSKMTIFLDQQETRTTSSAKIELKSVVLDTESSSCAACAVGQIEYDTSSQRPIETDQAVLAIDQFLHDRKENESKLNGVNGKVVVFFNFENGDSRSSNNKIQAGLDKNLRNLFTRHQDVKVYAVGLDKEILKKYAKKDPTSVLLSAEGNEKEVAKTIYDKISSAPGILQYPECRTGQGEGAAVFENFVSPFSIQHWEMPAEYFFKSINSKVIFETQNRPIRVCHNRATMKPEHEMRFCNDTLTTNRIEFKFPNPCERFQKETCSSVWFSVIGMNPTNGDSRMNKDYCSDINDQWCNKLDSIKFKVLHDGVRCSGSWGLTVNSAIILLTALFSFILNKIF